MPRGQNRNSFAEIAANADGNIGVTTDSQQNGRFTYGDIVLHAKRNDWDAPLLGEQPSLASVGRFGPGTYTNRWMV